MIYFGKDFTHMKIAVITDTHLDARQSSPIFLQYMHDYYEEVFFPMLKEQNIKTILHLGDFTDNRNHISLSANKFMIDYFGQKLKENNIKMYLTLGNHDLAYRNTSSVHSLIPIERAFPDNIEIVSHQKEIDIDGQKFMMCGWLNQETMPTFDNMLNTYKGKKDTILCGHFEFVGAKHYKNSQLTEHGLAQEDFSDWQDIWSGHFHHKNRTNNVFYVGSLFYLNWQDYNDDRGFHIFDTKTKEMNYVKNEYSLFYEYVYDETKEPDYSFFKDSFVRIVKNEISSDAAFLEFLTKVQKHNPIKLDVIDTSSRFSVSDVDIDEETTKVHVKELNEYLTEYLDVYYKDLSEKDVVKKSVDELFKQAQDIRTKGENS